MRYFIDTGTCHINKLNEELCGDNVEFEVCNDRTIGVLADGLGSGVKANVLSTLTSKIALTMVKHKACIEDVVDTIVKTLPICQIRDLAYSTVTIIDLKDDGDLYIMSFDNPNIVLKRDGMVFPLKGEERIVAGQKISEIRKTLKEDDMIIALSDGVVNAGGGNFLNQGWDLENICSFIQKFPDELSSLSIAKKIISTSNYLYQGRPFDDATALVMKFIRKKKINIFVGPPLNKSDDSLVVEKLIGSHGKRVVCGGTAAKIVARELGQDIKIDMENNGADIPPIGYIKGIDLVTEGVLTLKVCLEILEKYKESIYNVDDLFIEKGKKNGAYLLLKCILDEGTHIEMIVGRRVNPAHREEHFPKDLASKLEIVRKIRGYLRDLGKVVNIEYY